ncbi:hypothetical protein BOTCAL_0359g00080 [Botryotinia calthae]|uniref:Uncharacterized protein n=1 Tax=Botryotinia calthae TaxID=38488 RepID=A0A4Y8CS62_9HELO|nr:hypothetical protein BOTCAL_0359g00080 [Botryotinia calthae]
MSLESLLTPESGNYFTKIIRHDTYSPITPDTSTPTHSGKVVFVSGASKGIGLETAISYVKSGVSGIIISGRSSLASVEREIEEVCKSANIPVPKILALKLDILDFASVTEAAKSIETTFGRLDILINNSAYFSKAVNMVDGDKDEWWMGFEVNIRGLYWVTKSLLPLLLKTDGGDKTIVNATSIAALFVSPGISSYQISKFALARFTESLTVEYGDQGLLAYSIHPGSVPTDLAQGLPEKLHETLIDTPQLPADTISYLTSQRREWLASRYLSCNWDMNEIMSREKEIVDGDKLIFQMKF